jgi:hypothetical protein
MDWSTYFNSTKNSSDLSEQAKSTESAGLAIKTFTTESTYSYEGGFFLVTFLPTLNVIFRYGDGLA